MKNISPQDELAEEANLHILKQAISEFEREGCHVDSNGCLLVAEYEKKLSICSSFDIFVTAPNGIMEVEMKFFRSGGPILLSIQVEKSWKSGFLSQIVLASQKKVGCDFHKKYSTHNALTAFLAIAMTLDMVPQLVGYVVDVDRKAHEVRARISGQDKEFASALKEREQESERARNLMRKDIAMLQLGIDEEARNYLDYMHEQEEKFEALLDNVLQNEGPSTIETRT